MHPALIEVERVICYSDSWEQYIILKEVNGPRRLTLITGYCEVTALFHFLKREPKSRPQTYDSWLNTVIALGTKPVSVCVHDRRDDAYLAEIRLLQDNKIVTVDSRPSDALVLALQAGVPFYFMERVLAQYSISEPEPS
jgi:bifunctional DNase/RNase